MKKICYITTVSSTLRLFVLPTAQYLQQHTDWEIVFICNQDASFEQEVSLDFRYIPVAMKRGISLGGILAMLRMLKIVKINMLNQILS